MRDFTATIVNTSRCIAGAISEIPAEIWIETDSKKHVSCADVCFRMLASHRDGSASMQSECVSMCWDLGKQQWLIPSEGLDWQIWEFSESRLRHGLSRGQFKASDFWREFCRIAHELCQ